jgi:hypothetical protein
MNQEPERAIADLKQVLSMISEPELRQKAEEQMAELRKVVSPWGNWSPKRVAVKY